MMMNIVVWESYSDQENWRGLQRARGRIIREVREIRSEQEHPEHPEQPEKFKY